MTKEQFAKRVMDVAAFSGVVDERAVEDPEGYDHGLTIGRLRGMAEVLYAEFIAGRSAEPADVCPHCGEDHE